MSWVCFVDDPRGNVAACVGGGIVSTAVSDGDAPLPVGAASRRQAAEKIGARRRAKGDCVVCRVKVAQCGPEPRAALSLAEFEHTSRADTHAEFVVGLPAPLAVHLGGGVGPVKSCRKHSLSLLRQSLLVEAERLLYHQVTLMIAMVEGIYVRIFTGEDDEEPGEGAAEEPGQLWLESRRRKRCLNRRPSIRTAPNGTNRTG